MTIGRGMEASPASEILGTESEAQPLAASQERFCHGTLRNAPSSNHSAGSEAVTRIASRVLGCRKLKLRACSAIALSRSSSCWGPKGKEEPYWKSPSTGCPRLDVWTHGTDEAPPAGPQGEPDAENKEGDR